MSKTKEEMWASCESVGVLQAQNWIDSQSVKGVELSYVRQWLQHVAEKEEQQAYNHAVLRQAQKANTIAWLAAVASVISAITAVIAVYLGN